MLKVLLINRLPDSVQETQYHYADGRPTLEFREGASAMVHDEASSLKFRELSVYAGGGKIVVGSIGDFETRIWDAETSRGGVLIKRGQLDGTKTVYSVSIEDTVEGYIYQVFAYLDPPPE